MATFDLFHVKKESIQSQELMTWLDNIHNLHNLGSEKLVRNVIILVMEQQCRYCLKSYPESDFGVAKTIAGKVYRRRKCRYCYRVTKNILKGKRRRIIDFHKSEIGCKKCGIKDVRVLEFHHIDSKLKDFAIADYYYHQFGEDRLMVELKKCEVLCANCHRILHFDERQLK